MSAPVLETLRVSLSPNGVATVLISLPASANALTLRAFEELAQVFSWLDGHPDVRAVVLGGEGSNFCAGINLSALGSLFAAGDSQGCEGRRNLRLHGNIRRLQDAVSSLERCRVPVLAAVHGACLGGAVDLICAADVRYATTSAFFGVIEAELGFAADLGTLARLHHLVGDGRARELALTCRRFSGSEALSYGLVSACYDSAEALMEGVHAIAAQIASKSPLASIGTKAELLYARDASVQAALDHVAWRNSATLLSEDLRKSLDARAAGKMKGAAAVVYSRL